MSASDPTETSAERALDFFRARSDLDDRSLATALDTALRENLA